MTTNYSIAQQLEALRLRLLDLTGRNKFLNFKFSERSRTQVRIIDHLPDQIFEFLESDKVLTIQSLPHPPEYPEDEDEDAFLLLLEAMRETDEEYLEVVTSLEAVDQDSESFQKIERKLRDKVREELDMPPWIDTRSLSKVDYARSLDINPAYDLSTLASADGGKPSHRKNNLQTLLFSKELMRKLAGLRDGSRKFLQETGVNTLYLAFGMLEWYESDSSDKRLFAPLLLYPVALERQLKKGQYSYTIKSKGEDPEENFSLRERLKRDYGIVLPEFQALGDKDGTVIDTPESYFDKVAQVVGDQHRWKVRRFLTLSLFSFSRIALFQDLNSERWPDNHSLLNHPLLNTMLGGQDEVSQEAIAPDYEVDQPDIAKKVPLLITDADASQFSAMVDAMDGKNLVIEGPPGTGKSQTITNLIAVAVATGKKVLFVAEKKAALEVVYNRLANAGLGNYCLEGHSTDTTRQAFYERLKQRNEQEVPPNVSRALKKQIKECQKSKQQLTEYVTLLNQPLGQGGKTIQELFWSANQAQTLLNEISVPLGLEGLRDEQVLSMTEADLERKCQHLQEFSQQHQALVQQYSAVNRHPWCGITAYELSPIDQGDLINVATQWSRVLNQLQAITQDMPDRLGIEIQPTLAKLTKLQAQLQSCPSFNALIEPALLPILKNPKAQHAVTSLIQDLRTYQQKRETLSRFFSNGLDTDQLSLLPKLGQSLRRMDDDLKAIAVTMRHFQEKEQSLCDTSKRDLLARAKETCAGLNRVATELNQQYHLNRCPEPNRLYDYAIKLRKVNFFTALFSGKYDRAKSLWGSIQKGDRSLSNREIASIFETIADFQKQQESFKTNATLNQVCGQHFQGLETDFDAILKCHDFAIRLLELQAELERARQQVSSSEAISLLGSFYQGEQTDIQRLDASQKFAQSVIESDLPQALQEQLLTVNASTVIETIQVASPPRVIALIL